MKIEFPVKWHYLNKLLAYPYEYFNSNKDHQRPVNNLKIEDFFSKLKNKCPDDEEIQRTREFIKVFDIKIEERLTKLYLKTDVIFLADVF